MNDYETINETANKRGLAGESIFELAYKELRSNSLGIENVTKEREYMKMDIDYIIHHEDNKNTTVEVKTDMRAINTGNFPVELCTHMTEEVKLKLEKELSTYEKVSYNDIAEKQYVNLNGFFHKTKSDCIFNVNVEEKTNPDKKHSNKYKLNPNERIKPFYFIDTQKLNDYVKSDKKFNYRFAKQYEKDENGHEFEYYNLIFIIPFDEMVKNKVSKVISVKSIFENKFFTEEYHSSYEIKQYVESLLNNNLN